MDGTAVNYVAREAGRLLDSARGRGRDPGLADMLIAATASVYRLTLLTRNVRDFDGCGVEVVDPFEGIGCIRAAFTIDLGLTADLASPLAAARYADLKRGDTTTGECDMPIQPASDSKTRLILVRFHTGAFRNQHFDSASVLR